MNDEILRRAFASRAAASHPGEEALVAFYRGGLSEHEEDAIREHLAACASCVELARDARVFVEAMGADEPVMAMGRAKLWLAAAATLAGAAIALIWVAKSRPVAPMPSAAVTEQPASASRSWEKLPIAAAPYTPAPEDELLYRSDGPSDASDFAEAMAPYVRGDYAAAEAALARFLQAHPRDARASFYRGVSLLLLGSPEEAEPLLRVAAESGPAPEGAHWYLGLARLQSGNEAAALRELDAAAAQAGPNAAEAAKLAAEIRNGASSPPR
jgi:tetratricopeptide (TPR) repeat protein